MDHVEARILELVTRLYPDEFAALDGFCARHASYLDETIRAFDREVQFYAAYLDFTAPIKKAGLDFWAIREGVPVDEMEAWIKASEKTELLAGLALDAAWQTAWEDKVRTLGRSLAAGLLADDDAEIEIEQMIIAAITDIEAPQLAMLDVLVRWVPLRSPAGAQVTALDISAYSLNYGTWRVGDRVWSHDQITCIRPRLASIVPTLLGTLQRHGLVIQNDNAAEAIERYASELAKDTARYEREGGSRAFHQARWLWRTLRGAELAGLDAGQVLAEAIGERDLAGPATYPASSTPGSGTGPAAWSPFQPARGPRRSPPSPTPNAAPTPRGSPR
jgi:hypothetical protein